MTSRSQQAAAIRQRLYPPVRKEERRRELDRGTWAGPTQLIFSYDTVGRGVVETEQLDFGVVFEDAPFFSYGAEVQPGETIVSGDYPEITAGVKEWVTTDIATDDRAKPFYLGAFLWISIASGTAYRLRFRLSFEGTSMRNVEYFRDG